MKTVTMNELARIFGVEKHEPRPVKNKTCRKCGGEMVNVPGTNVFICQGKGGKPCDNRTYAKHM